MRQLRPSRALRPGEGAELEPLRLQRLTRSRVAERLQLEQTQLAVAVLGIETLTRVAAELGDARRKRLEHRDQGLEPDSVRVELAVRQLAPEQPAVVDALVEEPERHAESGGEVEQDVSHRLVVE